MSPVSRGSSPQVRGTPRDCDSGGGNRGLIPAGAGNTSSCAPGRAPPGAHPRRCGEHLDEAYEERPGAWLIPAGAGNTSPVLNEANRGAAHPRRCGEHRWCPGALPPWRGSSPQVRGTPAGLAGDRGLRGLIPAGAGNTQTRLTRGTWSWAHPRRCGEHERTGISIRRSMGSSPQVRGTLNRQPSSSIELRLIPAGAGNTVSGRVVVAALQAHPRRCGEHRPRTVVEVGVLGLIPAGAGNTCTCPRRRTGLTAHPRRCGEHSSDVNTTTSPWGSSPQVRGTHRRHLVGPPHAGLIPAGAGNTSRRSTATGRRRAHPRRCGEHGTR